VLAVSALHHNPPCHHFAQLHAYLHAGTLDERRLQYLLLVATLLLGKNAATGRAPPHKYRVPISAARNDESHQRLLTECFPMFRRVQSIRAATPRAAMAAVQLSLALAAALESSWLTPATVHCFNCEFSSLSQNMLYLARA
jgi:hypothetical protein